MEFSIAPTLPADIATRDDSAGKCRAEKKRILLLEETIFSIAPPVPATYLHQTHLMLVHVQTVTTAYLSRHLLGSMLAPQAFVVLAEWLAKA